MKMKIPTYKEWDKLVDVTDGNNKKMHWDRMFSYINDTEHKSMPKFLCTVRGYVSGLFWRNYFTSYRFQHVGFRPAVEGGNVDARPSEGTACVIGTLYMNGEPIPVPKDPTCDGDITDYIPGTKLEMREALDDPAYQVKGIYIGDGVFVADRNMVKYISAEDIEHSLDGRG